MKPIVALIVLLSCLLAPQERAERAERRPLKGERVEFAGPTSSSYRERWDPLTGKVTPYDPKPRIEPVDEKTGEYALVWIGQSGEELTIRYQRPDAIVAVVAANVSRGDNGFVYDYTIENLPSSGQQLSAFTVQTFDPYAEAIRITGGYTGRMTNRSPEFERGSWIFFGSSCFADRVGPGTTFSVRVTAAMPPGIVSCRISGGRSGYKGVGEEMPVELEERLPGYSAWPMGATLGPDASVAKLSDSARRRYLLERLARMQEFGWLSNTARDWYATHLADSTKAVLEEQTREFIASGAATCEVSALVRFVL